MAYQFQKASILIVDDMQPMLTLLGSLLKIFGFKNVYLAPDAQKGYELYCRYDPDIVILDWAMEPFDGIELTQRIRKREGSPNRFVPIIMMTGYSHRVRVEEARDAGVTEFLVKPFRAKDLYARIEQLIERPRRFVEADKFFGPDRRRRNNDSYSGPTRRDGDEEPLSASDEATLRKLRENLLKSRGDD